jgi:hypothetical protein
VAAAPAPSPAASLPAEATDPAEPTEPADAQSQPDPAAATARLAQRVDGWTFKVPRWVTDRLLVTRDDLLEAQTPPSAPAS